MEHLRRYSIYFKTTHRLITQSKIKAVTYILQILTLPTWLEKPGKKVVLSLNCLAHVLCTSMLCFNIWHECLPVSPQGQIHPGQQIKRAESHFLLQFEITFMKLLLRVRILFLYLSALFFLAILIESPFASWSRTVSWFQKCLIIICAVFGN